MSLEEAHALLEGVPDSELLFPNPAGTARDEEEFTAMFFANAKAVKIHGKPKT